MIIRGGAAGNVKWWSDHLRREDTNERTELVELRGVVADNLQDALFEMKWLAAGSRSQGDFMYQANINPMTHERLTPEQRDQAIDTLERNLGFEGHQRVVYEHEKHGRVHWHAIWNRVDPETMRVADIGGNYLIHEETQAELELAFDLTPTPTPSIAERQPTTELWEIRAAERSGIDPKAMKIELTELWQVADSGQAFVAAVEERGYVVARGDRRDFCVIDEAGTAHSLARRLEGVRAAGVSARMIDVDRDGLPSVEEARQWQRAALDQEREPDLDLTAAVAEVGDELTARTKPEPVFAPYERDESAEIIGYDDALAAAAIRKAQRDDFSDAASGLVRPAPPETVANQPAEVAPESLPPIERSFEGNGNLDAGDGREDAPAADMSDVAGAVDRALSGAAKGAIVVLSAIGETVGKLADFIASIFDGGDASPQPTRSQVEQYRAERRALAAMESIADDLRKGSTVQSDDLRNLSRAQLESIRSSGDQWLIDEAQRIERDRERGRGWER